MCAFSLNKFYRLKETSVDDFLDSATLNEYVFDIIGLKPFKILDIDYANDVLSIEVDGKVYTSNDIYTNLGCIFTDNEFGCFEEVDMAEDVQKPNQFEFDESKTYAIFTKGGDLIQTPTTSSHIMEMLQKMDLTESEVLIFEHATTAKSKTVIQFS